MITSAYCAGCNTHYYPGCGEEEWHARCPHRCGLCQLLCTGRTGDGSCQGHTVAEVRAAIAARRAP